jgi:hypothetical protein
MTHHGPKHQEWWMMENHVGWWLLYSGLNQSRENFCDQSPAVASSPWDRGILTPAADLLFRIWPWGFDHGKALSQHDTLGSYSQQPNSSRLQQLVNSCSFMLINVDVNVDYMLLSTGWWFQSLWKILFSWGGYSQYMENKKHVPNHQPVIHYLISSN